MNGPVLRPVGTYRVTPGYRAVRAAILRNCGREGIRQALSALVLVEIEVVGATSSPSLPPRLALYVNAPALVVPDDAQ